MTDSIETGSNDDPRASGNAHVDDGAAPSIKSQMSRSEDQEASEWTLEDGDDVSLLLALKLTCAEKPQENIGAARDSNRSTNSAPLLGTSYSQSVENAGGSLKKRSPESVCYKKLLRENGPSLAGKSQKTVRYGAHDCYI